MFSFAGLSYISECWRWNGRYFASCMGILPAMLLEVSSGCDLGFPAQGYGQARCAVQLS